MRGWIKEELSYVLARKENKIYKVPHESLGPSIFPGPKLKAVIWNMLAAYIKVCVNKTDL